MTKKIFSSIFIAAVAVLVSSLAIIVGCLYSYFSSLQESQMEDEMNIASVCLENGISLDAISSDRYRYTLIAADGTVLFDTKSDADNLDSHSDREEIVNAFLNGEGRSSRYSSTLLEKTMYYARRLTDGTVLRISMSYGTVGILLLGMLQPILVVSAIALILSGILAHKLSKRIVQPLNNLDLEHPLDNDNSYPELSPLLVRINRQRNQIATQLRELRQRTDSFEQITANMQEGLLLLDSSEHILSLNPSAKKIFNGSEDCLGKDILFLDRDHELTAALKSAEKNGHSEIFSTRNGRYYQIDISRIVSENEPLGSVILTFDITERREAEQSRREFTANVSHELKTPLQGIIGSAELLDSGLVKQEDTSKFIKSILLEANKLVTLVNDIISLSRLDEGAEMPKENVELMSIAEETIESLRDKAAENDVTLYSSGESVTVNGVRRLLHEIIFNLTENAIKYNIRGGKVTVSTGTKDGNAFVRVSDTGIGIPSDKLDRVFERFYRVDSSHSKTTGGTGLGLSIVKHAVAYHNGSIKTESSVDASNHGTTITVTLPLD